MERKYELHYDTELARALKKVVERIRDDIWVTNPEAKLYMRIAGGTGVHLYTGYRQTEDIDAENNFTSRFNTDDITEIISDGKGGVYEYGFDRKFTTGLTLFHEDYIDNCIEYNIGIEGVDISIMHPVDIAVSKIERLSDDDREDIAVMFSMGLFTYDELKKRIEEAMLCHVGGLRELPYKIKTVLDMVEKIEKQPTEMSDNPDPPQTKKNTP